MTAEFTPGFALHLLSVTQGLRHNPGRMLLIVRRPYAHLEDRLHRAFEGREDVQVVLDRRRGERRGRSLTVQPERRRAERRAPKEDLLEVVIEGIAE